MRLRSATAVAALGMASVAACSAERARDDVGRDLVVPDVRELDRDGDRLDDAFLTTTDDEVVVDIVLSRRAEQAQIDAFVAAGGVVTHRFQAVSHGWLGRIRRSALAGLPVAIGSSLVLVHAPKAIETHLDEATRCGRVRPVWAPGFAGVASGLSGTADITIAIVDTGVDVSHTDLAGRMQGFKDYTASADPTAIDPGGHGTHVAGIATGTGAAFGSSDGTLLVTAWGNLTGVAAGAAFLSPIHTPAYFGSNGSMDARAVATFSAAGGTTTTLQLETSADESDVLVPFSLANGTSPLSVGPGTAPAPVAARMTPVLGQSNPAAISTYAIATSISGYPAVGDGFNTLRGVAPGCRWFSAKVFSDTGNGSLADVSTALDDIVVRRAADSIKVVNMSIGVTGGGIDTVERARVTNTVANGIVVVVSAGNNGPNRAIGDPARAPTAITVGSTNDVGELTDYTSNGSFGGDPTLDAKPDVLAPGGSFHRSLILSADSNTDDGGLLSLPDARPNDYTNLAGTSMAAPFVSGSAALVIDAMQRAGVTWTFATDAQPRFVKMMLAASATETGFAREHGVGFSPTVDRAAAPKDQYEGYGIVNPDAAVEAVTLPFASPLTGFVGATRPEWDRRAWGRNVALTAGTSITLFLDNPATADFDLYLYSATPDVFGNPVLLASHTTPGAGADESLTFTPAASGVAYLFVKRVSGFGTFTLTQTQCGDAIVGPGEECETGPCCISCHFAANGAACDDGNACTTLDGCVAGTCIGSTVSCPPPADACHAQGTCAPATGVCDAPVALDGTPCGGGVCAAGVCSAPPVDAGVDAEPDAAPDAESDAAPDAESDAAIEAGPDAAQEVDAAPPPIDSGTPPPPPSATATHSPPSPTASSSPPADAFAIEGGGGCNTGGSRPSGALALLVLLLRGLRRRVGRGKEGV